MESVINYLIEYSKGNKENTWFHHGPLADESKELPLTLLNQNGFLTTCSQPGLLIEGHFSFSYDDYYKNGSILKQLPFCDGWIRNDLIKDFKYNFRVVDGKGKRITVTWIDDVGITSLPCYKRDFLYLNEERNNKFLNLRDFESFMKNAESNYSQVEFWANSPEDNEDFWKELVKYCYNAN
jgi:hypothetical protein